MNRIRPREGVKTLIDHLRPEGPEEVTLQAMRLAAIALGAVFAAAQHAALPGLLLAGGVLAPLEVTRRARRYRLAASLYAYLRKLIGAEEEEADRAQDRRAWRRVLHGQWQALAFGTHREEERATVRPGRYVHVHLLGGGVWPTRDHVTSVTVSWAPIVEINHTGIKSRILNQVAAWYGGDVEVIGGWRDGWDTRARRVEIAPKGTGSLPTEAPYPGPAGNTTPTFTQELGEVER